MRTVSALDVRRHFGELLDQAAAGEHIVIERAGQPRAALVPLEVLDMIDPERELARKRQALDELRRLARLTPASADFDAVATLRRLREERADHIMRVVDEARDRGT